MTKLKKDTYRKELGQWIAFVRKSLRDQDGKPLSQQKLLDDFRNKGLCDDEEKGFIDIRAWQRYEQGKCLPCIKRLVWLREGFDANLNFIIAGTGNPFTPGNPIPKSWETVGQRVDHFRMNLINPATGKRYTQQEMANLFGCAPDSWRHFELNATQCGSRAIPLTYLEQLNLLFNVDLNWLLAGG